MKGKSVLIVEDEIIIAECMRMELMQAGYECYGYYTTGIEAVEAAKKHKPDIILMDVHINGTINGIETARKIQEIQDSLVILMTGFDKKEILNETKDLKNIVILEKPIEIFQIENILAEKK